MVGSLLRLHSRCSRVTRFSRFSVEPRSRGIARGRPTARDGTSSRCYCGNVTRTGRAWPAFAASHQCYRFSVDLISKQSWHWRTSAQASRPSSCCARRAAALAGRAAPGFQSSARARPWSLQSPGSQHCHKPRPRRDPRRRWSRRSLCHATTLRIYSLAARRPPSPFALPPSPPPQRWPPRPPPHAAPALQPWRPLADLGAGSGYKSHSLPRPVCSFSDARLHACAERIRIYVEAIVLLCHRKANSVGP